MPATLYVSFALQNIASVSWLFLFDRNYKWVACLAQGVTAFFGIVGMSVSIYNVHKYRSALEAAGLGEELKWVIGLVHNGLGLYTAWYCVATLVNLLVFLMYDLDINAKMASMIVLSLISVEVFMWFVLDNFVFWRATRLTFTPYIVAAITLTGITEHSWGLSEDTNVFKVVLVIFIGIFLLTKVILTCVRGGVRVDMVTTSVVGKLPIVGGPVMVKQQPLVPVQLPQQQQQLICQVPQIGRLPTVEYIPQPIATTTAPVRYMERPVVAAPPPPTGSLPVPIPIQTISCPVAQPMPAFVNPVVGAQCEPVYLTQRGYNGAYYY